MRRAQSVPMSSGERTRRVLVGAAIGVALWSILFAFRLLPSFTIDVNGLAMVMIVCAIIGATRFEWVLRYLLIAEAFLLVIVAFSPISQALAGWWARSDVMPAEGVQAIVSLSGGLNNQGMITAEALDHLISSLELVKDGKSPILVTTTVEQGYQTGHFTSAADQARLISLFGGNVEWIRAPIGYTTRDEALNSAKLLFPRGVKHIAVVASPMHTRRACATFETVGFDVVCTVSRTSVPGGAKPASWPPDRLASFGDWVYEVLAVLKYRIRGYMK